MLGNHHFHPLKKEWLTLEFQVPLGTSRHVFFGFFSFTASWSLLELRFWAGYLDSPEAEAHGGHGSSRSTVDGSEIQNNHSLDGAKTLVNKWDNLPTSTG